jgi:hypothetical protein
MNIPNHFDAAFDELRAGELLYNLVAYLRQEIDCQEANHKMIPQKNILDKIFYHISDIPKQRIEKIIWRFTLAAEMQQEDYENWYLLPSADGMHEGYEALRTQWPSYVPNNLIVA